MNDVLSSEVWDFFCTRLPSDKNEERRQKEAFSDLEWFVQTDEMKTRLVRATVSGSDESEVRVRIPLMTTVFELTVRKPEDFPNERPDLQGEFIEGFEGSEWSASSSLYQLIDSVTEYYVTVDMAILDIREADSDGFSIVEINIDEDENNHLMVELRADKYKELVTLSIDINDYRSFPRILRCSNSSRTNSFDCEKWIGDDRLGLNLKRLYGEIQAVDISNHEVEMEQQVERDSFDTEEDGVEIMDFI